MSLDLLVLPTTERINEILHGISTDISLTKGNMQKVEFIFKDTEVKISHKGRDLKDFSLVWLSSFWNSRDIGYAIKIYLDHFNVKHTFVEKSTSKVTDHINFALNNILTPNTFFVNTKDIGEYIERIEDVCGYPLIIKNTKGSKGKYSAYIKDREELISKFKELPKHKKYIFQEYILNEYDWGVLVANGEVVSAEKSYPKNGEFRNNASNGAKEVFIDLKDIPDEIKDMAIKATKILGLSWARSDIIIDKETGIPYLLEVNRCPGITSGSTEITGARKFLNSYLYSTND